VVDKGEINSKSKRISCFIILIADAVSLTYVALVSAISSVQPFFVLLIAIVVSVFYPELLNESTERKGIIIKVIAAVTILGGGYFIVS
jgi:uncharacterized membrane protein YGL010W